VIYLAVIWIQISDLKIAKNYTEGNSERLKYERCKRRAARMSLVFPLWLPLLCLEGIWWLIKVAVDKEKVPVAKELCPSCRKEMPQRGPMDAGEL
jgi:hypothetical protein